MQKGDLVYVPSEVVLLQFYEEEKARRSVPVKVHRLERPTNLLLMEANLENEKYVKVWHRGDEWYVKRCDISDIGEACD